MEPTEYVAMMRRMLKAYAGRVTDADPEDLAGMIELRNMLNQTIAATVPAMRERHGWSWAQIGAALGITRQAAQQRFGA